MSEAVRDPERALALAYASAQAREALALLFRLDERLGEIVRATSDPMIGQMRLTWWHEALSDIAQAPQSEPLLDALRASGIDAQEAAHLVEGWEELLDPLPLGDAALEAFARRRGSTLFCLAAGLLGSAACARVERAGEGWALVDLAFHLSDKDTAERALALARPRFGREAWPRALRALGLLVTLARRDAAAGLDAPRRPGSPGRVARALWHGVTGR